MFGVEPKFPEASESSRLNLFPIAIHVLGEMLNVAATVLPGVYTPISTFVAPNWPNVETAKAINRENSRALNNFTIRDMDQIYLILVNLKLKKFP